MRNYEQTDVLVVGAGPVGMVAALSLAQQGVQVTIVDQEWRRTSRSYACALHGRSLRLLAELGLSSALHTLGWRVNRLHFHDRGHWLGEVHLERLGGDFPYLLVVPQSELEGLLEQELLKQSRLKLLWNHRLASLVPETTEVLSTIEKLAESATGYIVPTWDWVVKQSFLNHAGYVVGADGQHSYVRRALGIEWQAGVAPEAYEIFEFGTEQETTHEAIVVLEDGGLAYFWPLGAHRGRWAFSHPVRPQDEFSAKIRDPIQFVHHGSADALLQRLQQLLAERAPFFKNQVQEILWHGHVRFERRVARRFGVDRCWLAGDAAHQTGPVGMQSMNNGLLEARDLALRLAQVWHGRSGPELLDQYDAERQREWQTLVGLGNGVTPGPDAPAWVKRNASRLLPCLPASGEELRHLAAQIGLVLKA